MPTFSYIALERRGSEQSGRIDALNPKQAGVMLRGKGLFPTEVLPLGDAGAAVPSLGGGTRPSAGKSFELRMPFVSPVKSRDMAAFTRQLGTLLHAGMPLLRSLQTLSRQERNVALRRVIDALAENIRSGTPLSDAMAQHDRLFDRLYISMIRAGEAGGVLDSVLHRLARFQEKSLQLRGKVKAAMVYPLIVLLVAVAILAGLLVFVVPKFKQIFADLLKGAPLPPLTQWVLTISDAVRHNVLVVSVVLVIGVLAFQAFRRRDVGARMIDALAIKLPLFGDLVLKAVVARFGRTLGTLLGSGVPILPALLIARDTCGNAQVALAITSVHDRVKEGASVAGPLADAAVFPPLVPSMIEVGEHSGQLSEMLNKVADIYEDEVDNAVAGLSSLIEPVLILFLAVVVGTVVIALFLPIIRIVQLLT
jgi:type IV pilus assembly protein PilC